MWLFYGSLMFMMYLLSFLHFPCSSAEEGLSKDLKAICYCTFNLHLLHIFYLKNSAVGLTLIEFHYVHLNS